MASSQQPPTKQASEEQPPPDEEQGANDQTIVLLDVKPGENIGMKVNKDLGVMQVLKTGPCFGQFAVGDVITAVRYFL